MGKQLTFKCTHCAKKGTTIGYRSVEGFISILVLPFLFFGKKKKTGKPNKNKIRDFLSLPNSQNPGKTHKQHCTIVNLLRIVHRMFQGGGTEVGAISLHLCSEQVKGAQRGAQCGLEQIRVNWSKLEGADLEILRVI